MKEVRTFEEVFKSIKAKAKDFQTKKQAFIKRKEQLKREKSKKEAVNKEEEIELYESDPDLVDDSDLEEQHLCNMYNFAAE